MIWSKEVDCTDRCGSPQDRCRYQDPKSARLPRQAKPTTRKRRRGRLASSYGYSSEVLLSFGSRIRALIACHLSHPLNLRSPFHSPDPPIASQSIPRDGLPNEQFSVHIKVPGKSLHGPLTRSVKVVKNMQNSSVSVSCRIQTPVCLYVDDHGSGGRQEE